MLILGVQLLIGFTEKHDKYSCKEHNVWINKDIPTVFSGLADLVFSTSCRISGEPYDLSAARDNRGTCTSTTGECILAMSTLASSPSQQELPLEQDGARNTIPMSSAFLGVYCGLYLVGSQGMNFHYYWCIPESAPGAQLPVVSNGHQIYMTSALLFWVERLVWTCNCACYGLAVASSSREQGGEGERDYDWRGWRGVFHMGYSRHPV